MLVEISSDARNLSQETGSAITVRSRRTYAFVKTGDRWVQQANALFFEPSINGWLGHNYGHQFIYDEFGRLWIFYERVSEVGHLGRRKFFSS